MKVLIVVALVACSALAVPVAEEYHEARMEPRFISTFNNAADLFKNHQNRTFEQNLKSGASLAADMALTWLLNPFGAMFAKKGVGLAGVGLAAGSNYLEDLLKDHPFMNTTFAKRMFDQAEEAGKVMSDYANTEKIMEAVDLAQDVMAGKLTLEESLKKAGTNFIENRLVSPRQNAVAAATSLEAVGAIMETLGKKMDYLATTSTEERIGNVLSKIHADKMFNPALNSINKAFNVNVQEILSVKLAELDKTAAPMREKVASVGQLMDKIGAAVEDVAGTVADVGTADIKDYPTMFNNALKNLGVL